MANPTPFTYARRTVFGLALGLVLTLSATTSANAAVLYDFSLAANGAVGPVHVVLRTDDFLPPSGLRVLPVTDPIVEEVSAGTPIDPSSVVGFEALATTTRFGLALFGPGGGPEVLYTVNYPADFFVFERTPNQTGTFQSISGLVRSGSNLETRSPVATLVVTQTDVPEPATLSLLALASLGAFARRRRQPVA